MNCVAIADIHGHLIEVPECDLLLIAGDICPIFDHTFLEQRNWLKNKFAPWLESVPAKHIVGIAGNHDFIWERTPNLVPPLSWTYLQDEGTEIEGIKIWGTPWQNPFFDWAFNLTEDKQKLAFGLIPDDTDIIVCHGPPLGYGDINARGQYCGSRVMLKTIVRIQPDFMICGHIHEGYGKYKIGRTQVFNASVVNRANNLANPPIEFSIDKVLTKVE